MRNPFPRTPAILEDFELRNTVLTSTIRLASAEVDTFLHAAASRSREEAGTPGSGMALAYIGAPGSGKSHLRKHLEAILIPAARRTHAPHFKPHFFTAGGSPSRFLTIYREQLITDLSLSSFRRVLRFYYAAATADLLQQLNASAKLIKEVRTMGTATSEVVQRLRLSEHDIRRAMAAALRVITNSDELATQLSQHDLHEAAGDTRRPAAVWEWLNCKPPDPMLVEQGIAEQIDSDEKALSAFTMLAFLYGRAGEPFLLTVDEIERMLQESDHSPTWNMGRLQGFERLVNVLIDTGGITIIFAATDNIDRFSAGFHERVRIQPVEPFTEKDAKRLIDFHVPPNSKIRFPETAIAHLTRLAEGNPRFILDVCHRSWELLAGPDPRGAVEVGTLDIDSAVRQRHELPNIGMVNREVGHVLQTGGWAYENPEEHRFRIARGLSGAAVQVLVTDSILNDATRARLLDRLEELLRAQRQELIIVINGYLRPSDRRTIAGVISRQPITYKDRSFRELLREQLLDANSSLDEAGRQTLLTTVREEVLRVSRQHSYTQSILERLNARVEHVSAAGPAPSDMPRHEHAESRLPALVLRQFTVVLDALRRETALDRLFPGSLAAEPAIHTDTLYAPPSAARAFYEHMGLILILQRLVEALMDAVSTWFAEAQDAALRGRPRADLLDELEMICTNYLASVELIPLFRLATPATDETPSGFYERGLRFEVIRDLERLVTGLGSRVQEHMTRHLGFPSE